MTLEKTLTEMSLRYSDIFPSREDAIHHLFLVLGNGYDWKDGELVDPYPDEPSWNPTTPTYREALELIENGATAEWTKAEMDGDIYCEGKYLARLPADVKPDWRGGYEEALALCQRKGVTPTQMADWLADL